MDFYTSNRFNKWFIVVLVILNLALLATIWYPRLISSKKEAVEPIERDRKPGQDKDNRVKRSERLVRFLEKELSFTRDQVKQFLELREKHFQKVDQLQRQLENLRKEMMDHLLEKEPDTAEVDRLASEIGRKMSVHEKSVFNHFLELMEVCDARQKEKYRALMREILAQLAPPRDHHIPETHQPSDHLHRPGQMDIEDHLRRLRQELELTDAQVEKIRPIIEAARERLEKIPSDPRYRNHDERRQARDRVHQWEDSQIEFLLTDQQKIRYQEMKERRKELSRK